MPYNQILHYKEQAISTMSKGEQLVALYKEALKNLHYGSVMMKEKNFETANKCTEKSKRIFIYLSSILDNQYEISTQLYQLYYFFNQEIIRAEIKQDASPLDGIIPLVEELTDTWTEAEKLCHMHK